MEVDSMLE
jgi:hypothetical protein